jgi:septal ring factor EnvC (AmiA/AmiB activator)
MVNFNSDTRFYKDTLYRVAIKTHPHNDVLYALDLETDDGGDDDEELIEALQKTVKQMQKGLKKEAKRMKDDMLKMRDDINKKHAKDIKKLKKQIAAHDRGRVLAEEEIVEKIHKQLEEEAIRKEHQREDAQSMIITSTVDDEDLRSGGSCVGTKTVGEAREEILKEVDELLGEELAEVRRELREEIDETRGQLMEAIEALQRDVGDSQKKQEKSGSEAKEKEKSEEEMKEMKVLLEALKDEVARLKGEVAQLRTEKAANAVRIPQREAGAATQPPELVAASHRYYPSTSYFFLCLHALTPNASEVTSIWCA